jgi:hypothetical protein
VRLARGNRSTAGADEAESLFHHLTYYPTNYCYLAKSASERSATVAQHFLIRNRGLAKSDLITHQFTSTATNENITTKPTFPSTSSTVHDPSIPSLPRDLSSYRIAWSESICIILFLI